MTAPQASIPAQPKNVATAVPGTGRRIAVWSIVGVASLIMLVSILTMWVNRQMLSNDSWTSASKDLIQDQEVQSALAVYVVNQLYENVDVAGELQAQLPKNLKPLAAPVASALRQPAGNAVEFLLGRPRVQQLFVQTSSVAHQKLVNVLENKTGYGISTGSGVVTLDLHQLVQDLGLNVGLSQKVLDKLPPDAGVITVMSSDQLGAAQKGVRLIKALSVWLLALVLGLYALAIWLARGRRRETLRSIGWAFIVVGLLTLLARRLLGNYAIDALVTPGYERSAHHVWLIETSILGDIGRATILYGAIGVLGAVLAGPTRLAVAARRRLAPFVVERPGYAWGGVGLVFLLAVLWGGTHALRTWWGVLLLGALLAVGVEALRRQMAAETGAEPAGP